MNLICVLIAILCGIVLIFEFPTGSLSANQIAGIGIIFAALASVVPATWSLRA